MRRAAGIRGEAMRRKVDDCIQPPWQFCTLEVYYRHAPIFRQLDLE